jgi:hypothetical protein
LALAALPGCGGVAGEYCDLACDCENCNDEEAEICIANVDYEQEISDIKGCDVEFDEIYACVIEKGDCDNDVFGTADCNDEAEDFIQCIDD